MGQLYPRITRVKINTQIDSLATQISSSRSEEVMLRDKLILEDMCRLNKEHVQAFEASKQAKKALENFVVKNPFLTENPLFHRSDGATSSSSATERGDATKKKPPDPKTGDRHKQPIVVAKVGIDQVSEQTRVKTQV
ncbi:hypothetical protein PIB30_007045 [Stylosanthes scabra]|uniref:Uncharacterized protein n=1 Tax=Stylosanthes scabra TaxID=79078 RepID=A0ABU6Q5C1_9FABA|nr:hypothetical protein [Stylosanthes scabra]